MRGEGYPAVMMELILRLGMELELGLELLAGVWDGWVDFAVLELADIPNGFPGFALLCFYSPRCMLYLIRCTSTPQASPRHPQTSAPHPPFPPSRGPQSRTPP